MDGIERAPTRHKLDVDDYHRMVPAGILRDDDRVELIDGEVIDMAPIGIAHASVVSRTTESLLLACARHASLRVQNPVRLDRLNEPQPDFAIVRRRADFYATAHPGPADVLLLIEVADSSLRFDRAIKLPLYARFAIPEVWIIDLAQRTLDTHRTPLDGCYTHTHTHHPGDILTLALAPEITLSVEQILG